MMFLVAITDRVGRLANDTLHQSCEIDEMKFIFTDGSGLDQPRNIQIMRDSCHAPEFFCDSSAGTCNLTKTLHGACERDQQCESVSQGQAIEYPYLLN